MAIIEWTADMSVGIPAVDHEHETLINDINALCQLIENNKDKAGVVELLGRIHAEIEAHFALEEKIMRDKGFRGYEAHKEDHDRLLEEIRDIMDEVSDANILDTSGNLTQRLMLWFSEHFRTLDRSFHTFVNG